MLKGWVNKSLIIGIVIISIIAIGLMSDRLSADSSTSPGSIDDPVVTKSYVDQAIAQGAGGHGESASAALEIVTVPSGKTLVAAEEGTEFIVRAGRAIAYSVDKDGISDLTDGMDLTNGKSVSNNHLIVSPRIGRGIAPDPAIVGNQIIVMVRGSHEVK